MANQFTQLGVNDYSQAFKDALEFVDPTIQHYENLYPTNWSSMIKRGAYELGAGYEKKVWQFFDGVGDQAGLGNWQPIQISRAASGDDPGVDACSYNPDLVTYGMRQVSYSGFQTSKRTSHICVKDIRFIDDFTQQLNLIMGNLANISMSVWENYSRERYMKYCADAGRAYVLSNGLPTSVALTYDPFSKDADGDYYATMPAGTEVSLLNMKKLRYYTNMFDQDLPTGSAIGTDSGRPLYGLCFDTQDFFDYIDADDEKREDYRAVQDRRVLIDRFGPSMVVEGYAFKHDKNAPRFKIKKTDATTTTLKRVLPKLDDSTAITIGYETEMNFDYLNAEYAMAIIYINDVFMIEIPPAGPSAPGGGTSFGASPSLNGEFQWLNIQNETTNLLNEVGFYFARFEAFAKQEINFKKPIMFLYKRCLASQVLEANVGDTATSAAEVGLAVDIVEADDMDLTNLTIVVTLTDKLARETGSISLSDDSGTAIAGVIADATAAPTYTLALNSTPTGKTYTAAGAAFVTLA